MNSLQHILGSPEAREFWLLKRGVHEMARGHKNLLSLCESGITLDLLDSMFAQLEEHLGVVSDPDMALNNLQRFVEAARSPLALAALFQRDPTAIPILLRVFSTSQYLSDLLVVDRESYDALRSGEGQPVSRKFLVDRLSNLLATACDAKQAMAFLRHFKHRETLRIAFGDVIVGQRMAIVAEQISFLAEAICEVSYEFCFKQLEEKWGTPALAEGKPCRYSILALGKLGGSELNYSSDIDLVAAFEGPQQGEVVQNGNQRKRTNQEFFEQLTRDIAKLIGEVTPDGAAYRVDLRLRPDGKQGRICHSLEQTIRYYENKGRTWERQALIKLRPVAGSQELGNQLIARLEGWVYQKRLDRLDISDIKVLKRKIEKRAFVAGEDRRNLKTGWGGIRDVEFTIQFLQLFGGGRDASVRSSNTLIAIEQLQAAGFLTLDEENLLSKNYAWLRRAEHCLQIMFDLQTHTLPESQLERLKLAIRMGYLEQSRQMALDRFDEVLEEVTNTNRQILNHLLHNAFAGKGEFDDSEVPVEADLVLDDEPAEELVREIFDKYNLSDPLRAQRNLDELARESTQFLSPHRCRHFLAAISEKLLRAVSVTPDPDATLNTLASVTEKIGAKGVLWELFQVHPPTLEMFVRLCASGDYLAQILRQNPGMIDELVDALAVDSLPSFEWLMDAMADLVTGAEDIAPIIHSFKLSQHLRVGVRDIVGRDSIQAKHQTLSNIAQICLASVVDHVYLDMVARYGRPMFHEIEYSTGSELVILGLGKLGGREPNYHSDLDVIFLYESDGKTVHADPQRSTTNQHFFSELASKISKFITDSGPYGQLYELDCRLRPSGKSGSLAVSFEEFSRYFESGQGQLWERLALCKSRVVYGNREPSLKVLARVKKAISSPPWRDEMAAEIYQMRLRMEQDCSETNIKRGVGGTVDVEFILQMLQLKHIDSLKTALPPGTLQAINRFAELGILTMEQAKTLSASYQLLRQVESGIRLMNSVARHELPEKEADLRKLAYLLRMKDSDSLAEQIRQARATNRAMLNEFLNS